MWNKWCDEPLEPITVRQRTLKRMSDEALEMARTRYGYGSWDAPFWFLGIEERQGEAEGGELQADQQTKVNAAIEALTTSRVEAWRALGGRELDDCREFHLRLGETRWHGEKAIPHPEWTGLERALFAYLGKETDRTSLLEYQRSKWGRKDGETCVLELAEPADTNHKTPRAREAFLRERIESIREKAREHKPAFLVLYGRTKGCQLAWAELTREAEPIEASEAGFADFARCGETMLAWVPHPASYGLKDRDWVEFGANLRQLATLPSAAMMNPAANAADERSQKWREGGGWWRGLQRLWRR